MSVPQEWSAAPAEGLRDHKPFFLGGVGEAERDERARREDRNAPWN